MLKCASLRRTSAITGRCAAVGIVALTVCQSPKLGNHINQREPGWDRIILTNGLLNCTSQIFHKIARSYLQKWDAVGRKVRANVMSTVTYALARYRHRRCSIEGHRVKRLCVVLLKPVRRLQPCKCECLNYIDMHNARADLVFSINL
jgi:hypothetical protein